MRVTAKKILSLNPCNCRKENFLSHHGPKASFNFEAFMDLETITAQDKVWVACRILPRHLIEIFAIDCAIRAETYAAAYAYAVAYAVTAYAAAERQTQIESLIWLVQNAKL